MEKTPVVDSAPAISVDNLSHWFVTPDSSRVVLHDISLAVRRHEFVAIVGESGCGKTTLLNIVAGLVEPSIGSCTVSIGDEPVVPPHRAIGYMFARDALLPWRTLNANVELGLEYRGIPRSERNVISRDLIERVGLLGYENAYPAELSQGMRQRCNLARVLATAPEILLVDEPFAAVDAETRIRLQQQFLDLWAEQRQTVVFVTHDLLEAVLMADRVIVMARGEIKAEIVVPIVGPRNVEELRFDPELQTLSATLWGHLSGRSPASQTEVVSSTSRPLGAGQ